jgi:multiple antibiotic resistance protein
MMGKIIRDFMTIWTTIDPISNLALFASLTATMHRSEQRRIALRVTDVILRSIGRQGAAILTRVMGIILTALSVEFVLIGLSISSWARPLH